MDYICVPIILVLCYLVGEVYKMVVKRDKAKYKFIPVLVSIVGGILGLILYYTYPEMIFEATNPVIAIFIGIVSGVASTGSHQIIKQLYGKTDENNDIKIG